MYEIFNQPKIERLFSKNILYSKIYNLLIYLLIISRLKYHYYKNNGEVIMMMKPRFYCFHVIFW